LAERIQYADMDSYNTEPAQAQANALEGVA
jgi:hypothetical protein